MLPLNLFHNPNSINTLCSQVVAPTLTKQNTRGPLYQPTGANLNLNVNKKLEGSAQHNRDSPSRHATQQWYTAIRYHQLWHLQQRGRYLAAGRPTATKVGTLRPSACWGGDPPTPRCEGTGSEWGGGAEAAEEKLSKAEKELCFSHIYWITRLPQQYL